MTSYIDFLPVHVLHIPLFYQNIFQNGILIIKTTVLEFEALGRFAELYHRGESNVGGPDRVKRLGV